jgi:hypothetical protein
LTTPGLAADRERAARAGPRARGEPIKPIALGAPSLEAVIRSRSTSDSHRFLCGVAPSAGYTRVQSHGSGRGVSAAATLPRTRTTTLPVSVA